jgi:hypothetical protein
LRASVDETGAGYARHTRWSHQAMVRDANAGEGSNKIVYWSRVIDWKNQTLTPNPDTIYAMPFINTKDVGSGVRGVYFSAIGLTLMFRKETEPWSPCRPM